MKKNKIILEIGAEGGGLRVYKTKEHYFFTTDERTQVDLLAPEHPPTKELYNTTDFYDSFDQVMFHLHKKYDHIFNLYPSYIAKGYLTQIRSQYILWIALGKEEEYEKERWRDKLGIDF